MAGPSDIPNVAEAILELEQRIGLPVGFLADLREQDDWSFVLKSHALIEAAMSEAIAQHLGREELRDVLVYLELGDPRVGKMAIASKLGFIQTYDRRFLTEFSKLRNAIVHDVRKVLFTFANHMAGLDKNQLRQFSEGLSYAYLDEDKNGEAFISNKSAIRSDPKITIWHGLRVFLAIVSTSLETASLRRDATEMELEALRIYREISGIGA
jgi:hypothetical protein